MSYFSVNTEVFQKYAKKFYDSFTTKTRDNGERFVTLKDESERPAWAQDIAREAHDGMFPDDWRYEVIQEAAEFYANCDDPDDEPEIEADVYSADLYRWLASHLYRSGYVNDAVKEMGHGDNIDEDIQRGQIAEKEEVYSIVKRELEELAENDPDGLGEDDDSDE